jgi:hypothetical protein
MTLRQTGGYFTTIAASVGSKSRFRKLKLPENQLLSSLEFDTVDRVTSNFYDFLIEALRRGRMTWRHEIPNP